MRYVSTRGISPAKGFTEILLSGLASDGGLFMPEAWPRMSIGGETYVEAARKILGAFAGDSFSSGELREDIESAYAGFDTPEIAPLIEIAKDRYLLELFHGPTLAFKDIAMQVLGRLFARALAKRGGRATVIVATSGDTGSAAIAALGGLPNIDLFVIHPHNRVSDVQRRQMTASPHGNVHNIALEGTFDDGQAIVKALFADSGFAARQNLTAVNSINFARIAAQSVYYFTAAAKLKAPPVFVVPTGNFGDVFAGEAAGHLGLAIEKLVIATNANDILARALATGTYAPGAAHATLSPSMDIQVASNFERALFEASNRDAAWVREAMQSFAREKKLVIPPKALGNLRARYTASAVDDSKTLETIARIHKQTGRLIDPHTAVAAAAAEKIEAKGPVVILATAHPAKFPDAVKKATGQTPPLPPHMADLYEKEERMNVLPNGLAAIRGFIEDRTAHP
ncbi:MAG TPA: threonine synthase [Rhizomicrobium sp.]|nr:threonine synthase [Rhizomicrobium sp.]